MASRRGNLSKSHSARQHRFDAVADGKAATYLLAPNAVRKQMEDRWWKEPRVDFCSKATKTVAPGTVPEANGKAVLTVSRQQAAPKR